LLTGFDGQVMCGRSLVRSLEIFVEFICQSLSLSLETELIFLTFNQSSPIIRVDLTFMPFQQLVFHLMNNRDLAANASNFTRRIIYTVSGKTVPL